MTFAQVMNAYTGYMEHDTETKEMQCRLAWETTRWQTLILYNLQVKKKDKKRHPMQLIKFNWEKSPKMTEEDKEKLRIADEQFPKKLKHGNK